jgi:hypothetical protein
VWFDIAWTLEGEEHIARHAVTKVDVDDLLRSGRFYWRNHAGGVMIIGRIRGRYLVMFLHRTEPNSNLLLIGTCRPADPSEKALLLRRGKGVQ